MESAASRFNGTLKKWNAERGFGFVVADHGEQELFVHVTAFPRDGQSPVIGEPLSFEMELDKAGRKRAVRVRRPGSRESIAPRSQPSEPVWHRSRSVPAHKASNPFGMVLVAVLLIAGLGWYGYSRYVERAELPGAAPQSLTSPARTTSTEVSAPAFQCDGRKYCSEMSSCREAKLFLKNCPGMEMDGDGDGIPCEQQWCTGPSGG